MYVLETGNLSGLPNKAREITISLPELSEATFIERKNRFVGLVQVAGEIYPAHVPSSGRMKELLFPGNTVYVSPMPEGMRTKYRIHLAHYGKTLVSVDSLLPNRLLYKVLAEHALEEFTGYQEIKKEVGFGDSRFDLYLKGDRGRCLIEIKSVTLVDEGLAKFPDAPSARGTKHLLELCKVIEEGLRAAVIFVVQRNDAKIFSPNHVTDPNFTKALHQAAACGVEIFAITCQITKNTVGLQEYLPMQIGS